MDIPFQQELDDRVSFHDSVQEIYEKRLKDKINNTFDLRIKYAVIFVWMVLAVSFVLMDPVVYQKNQEQSWVPVVLTLMQWLGGICY